MRIRVKYLSYYLCFLFYIIYVEKDHAFVVSQFDGDLNSLLIYSNTYNMLGEKINIIHFLMIAFPTVLIISIFSDDISRELEKNACYIFTRSNRKVGWFFRKCIQLFRKLAVVNLIYLVTQVIIYRFWNFELKNLHELATSFCVVFLFKIMAQYILILLVNIIAMIFNGLTGYVVGIAAYFTNLIGFHSLYMKIDIFSLPFVGDYNAMYLGNYEVYSFYADRSVIYPVVWNIIYLLIIVTLGVYTIVRKEFM